jgi:general secretion pathway protein D
MTTPADATPFAARRPLRTLLPCAAACLALLACGSPALRDAHQFAAQGRHEQALAVLDAARKRDPDDHALQAAQQQERELAIAVLANQAAAARAAGRADLARDSLKRLEDIDPTHPRAVGLRAGLERDARQQAQLALAAKDLDDDRLDGAQAQLRRVLAESPGLPAARALQRRIDELAADAAAPRTIAAARGKRITLEFHDAPLRSVFESVGRTMGVNFVFEKDVRADAKINVFLHDVTLDEAMRVILSTQQLDRKLLNDTTMLVYPNTPAKQQDQQELVTRSFYLTNADIKQAQTLIKTMAKTRDVFIDERLNLVIVRDTPEVVQVIERLIASIDLPEPEVALEVEVMEIGTNELDSLGLQWPQEVQFGVPGFDGQVPLSGRRSFTTSVANPAVVATLNGQSGSTNLIANPKLRARNHEKAKVQIGERLPVFTSSAVANVGTSTTVTYIDTGLLLEVEPSVQLDNDVVIKINLEVTNLIGQVAGPQGSIAYRVGTRNANTSLRLRDGETQILAGLINEEDSKAIQGIPGASELPVLGRLFGVHTDTRNKSEIVLLITPRVVRNVGVPDAATLSGAAGNYANPGAPSARIRDGAGIAMPAGRGAAARPVRDEAEDAAPAAPARDEGVVVSISTSAKAAVGGTASVTLQNQSAATVRGELGVDAALLQPADGSKAGALAFELGPKGQKVFVLRVLPGAAGKTVQVQVDGLAATGESGENLPARIEGDAGLELVAK